MYYIVIFILLWKSGFYGKTQCLADLTGVKTYQIMIRLSKYRFLSGLKSFVSGQYQQTRWPTVCNGKFKINGKKMFVFKWQFSFVYKFHGSLAVFNLFFSYTDNATPPQPALVFIFSNYFITWCIRHIRNNWNIHHF